MARINRGSFITLQYNDTNPHMVLIHNVNRAGVFIQADSANAGNVALAFDNPALTTTGDQTPILLAKNDQYVEGAQDVNTGDLWIRFSSANDKILLREDTFDQ